MRCKGIFKYSVAPKLFSNKIFIVRQPAVLVDYHLDWVTAFGALRIYFKL